MKSYHERLLKFATHIEQIEKFWKHPHKPQRAVEMLLRMRRCMKQLHRIGKTGNVQEKEQATMYLLRLSKQFTNEVIAPKYLPLPQGYYDDS